MCRIIIALCSFTPTSIAFRPNIFLLLRSPSQCAAAFRDQSLRRMSALREVISTTDVQLPVHRVTTPVTGLSPKRSAAAAGAAVSEASPAVVRPRPAPEPGTTIGSNPRTSMPLPQHRRFYHLGRWRTLPPSYVPPEMRATGTASMGHSAAHVTPASRHHHVGGTSSSDACQRVASSTEPASPVSVISPMSASRHTAPSEASFADDETSQASLSWVLDPSRTDGATADAAPLTYTPAHSMPPPTQTYVPSVDRNRHFVRPQGGTDFSPHFVYCPLKSLHDEPGVKVERGSLRWQVMVGRASELESLRREHAHLRPSSTSVARSSSRSRASHNASAAKASPGGVNSIDGQQVAINHSASFNASCEGNASFLPPGEQSIVRDVARYGQASPIEAHALQPASPSPARNGCQAAVGSPTKAAAVLRARPSSSDVARRSSASHESAVLRKLAAREREAALLRSPPPHPNNVKVYL